VVVDAALADVVECVQDRVRSNFSGIMAVCLPEEGEKRGLGELGSAAETSESGIDGGGDGVCCGRQLSGSEVLVSGVGGVGPESLVNGIGIVEDPVSLLVPDVGDLAKNMFEAGLAVSGLWRKIGAAPKGMGVGRKKHGEGPAAWFAERLEGSHVDSVDVRSFFSVDLDVDEEVVHELGCFGVFEAFMGHDMAPVASGVADRQQYGLIEAFGFL